MPGGIKIPLRSVEDIVDDPRKYEEQWVALIDGNKTPVASGENLSKVIEEAREKGYDNPTFFRVPRSDCFYVL